MSTERAIGGHPLSEWPKLIPSLPWRPVSELPELYVGDSVLMAVPFLYECGEEGKRLWDIQMVTIDEDGYYVQGQPWEWSWDDAEFGIPIKDMVTPCQ